MKDTLRQIAVALTIMATIVVNILADALPINGLGTGQISDMFKVYFVPAGYVFSIWGLIYLGLIAFAVFQALPAQRENPRMRNTGWWICLGGLANMAWIFLWHYEMFALTVVAMLVLLATLIVTYLRLGIGRTKVSRAERYTTQLTFSIYLGWITVATVANITSLLDYLNWNGFGIAAEIWMGIVLVAVFITYNELFSFVTAYSIFRLSSSASPAMDIFTGHGFPSRIVSALVSLSFTMENLIITLSFPPEAYRYFSSEEKASPSHDFAMMAVSSNRRFTASNNCTHWLLWPLLVTARYFLDEDSIILRGRSPSGNCWPTGVSFQPLGRVTRRDSISDRDCPFI